MACPVCQEPEPETMTTQEIPTPETDANTYDPYPWNNNGPGRSRRPEVMYPIDDGDWVEANHARDLERRLIIAREALAKINHSCLTMEQAENIADKTLTKTAPPQ